MTVITTLIGYLLEVSIIFGAGVAFHAIVVQERTKHAKRALVKHFKNELWRMGNEGRLYPDLRNEKYYEDVAEIRKLLDLARK